MALSSTRLAFLGFSNLVLSQAVQCIYPHGECYELKLQKCNGSTSWTLHGLWPEWQNECEGPDFDENVLKDIHDEMEKKWPSCPEYGESEQEFWSHEWKKHGTCSGMGQLEYFKKALQMRDEYMNKCSKEGNLLGCSVCFGKNLTSQETCVGKTTLIVKFVDEIVKTDKFTSTLGIDYKTKMLWMRGKRVKLQIWDTAGQERFQTITQQYYRSAMGILMVYDVTSEASFENIARWNDQISKHADKEVQRILVGNKADAEDIAVSLSRGQELAEKYGIPFVETSAYLGENVNEARMVAICLGQGLTMELSEMQLQPLQDEPFIPDSLSLLKDRWASKAKGLLRSAVRSFQRISGALRVAAGLLTPAVLQFNLGIAAASRANGKQNGLPENPHHDRISREAIDDLHEVNFNKEPTRLWGQVKATKYGGIERIDGVSTLWTAGDYWNVDSNIMKWGKHEVRRNGACANHDVHRHDQITKLVLPPKPGDTRPLRYCVSGVVSPDCCFLEAWGFDLGLRDRQGNNTTLWKPAGSNEMAWKLSLDADEEDL
ncbi:unnamed protein product [Cladocopium goreaui]|uniref:Ras-related protein RABE1c (AtRABE1c) (Ras-related protein Ara-3) (Ras-related protein Rab8A) (AtRab8A) n=1 Tax=Cladocopium goreaui TaxID=2562237 RepID=A0A9P1DT52_9DINO|nr:unnamed protein product [Cladocopium goreaui]